MLDSLKISFQELSSQTGVVAVHLGDQCLKQNKLHLVDAMGFAYFLPAEKTCFVLQHKQPPWTEQFLSALDRGDRKQAEKILVMAIEAYAKRNGIKLITASVVQSMHE